MNRYRDRGEEIRDEDIKRCIDKEKWECNGERNEELSQRSPRERIEARTGRDRERER